MRFAHIYCLVLSLSSILFPFAITDIIFAYLPSNCTSIRFQVFHHVQFTLKSWLQISAYTSLSFLVIIISLLAIHHYLSLKCYLYASQICTLILWVFKMSWYGIGTVMLLTNVDGQYSQHCQHRLKIYMYFSIITSMVLLLVLACLGLITNVNTKQRDIFQ